MKKLSLLLLLPVSFIACKKRDVRVYECRCTWVRATTNKDTAKILSFPDMIKGTAQSSCAAEETIIPGDTDVKDSVTCNLL